MGASLSQLTGRRGFTLLEILTAMAVIVIIMTMLAMGVGGLLPLSKSKQAHTDLVHVQQALEAYRIKFGEYPKKVSVGGSTPSMEVILFNALAGSLAPNGTLGNYPTMMDRTALEFSNSSFPVVGGSPSLVANQILDPWGNPFVYRYDPDDSSWENFNYVLFSAGPDAAFTDVDSKGQASEAAAYNDDNIYAE